MAQLVLGWLLAGCRNDDQRNQPSKTNSWHSYSSTLALCGNDSPHAHNLLSAC